MTLICRKSYTKLYEALRLYNQADSGADPLIYVQSYQSEREVSTQSHHN